MIKVKEFVGSAASALGRIGPEAKEAVPALIIALNDQSEGVRSSAASALGRIRPEAKESVPALIIALNDQSEWVRHSAASALGEMGTEAKRGCPSAHRCTQRPEWRGW